MTVVWPIKDGYATYTRTLIFLFGLWMGFSAIGYFYTDVWETIFIVIISYIVTDYLMDFFIKKGRGHVKLPPLGKKARTTSPNIALLFLMIGILVSAFLAEGVTSFFLIPMPKVIGSWGAIILGSLSEVLLVAYHLQLRYGNKRPPNTLSQQ